MKSYQIAMVLAIMTASSQAIRLNSSDDKKACDNSVPSEIEKKAELGVVDKAEGKRHKIRNGNGNGIGSQIRNGSRDTCYRCRPVRCNGNGNGNGNGGPGSGNGNGNGNGCDCPVIERAIEDLEEEVEDLHTEFEEIEAEMILVNAQLEALDEIILPDIDEDIGSLQNDLDDLEDRVSDIENGGLVDQVLQAIIDQGGLFINEDWFIAANNGELVIGNEDDDTEYIFEANGDQTEI